MTKPAMVSPQQSLSKQLQLQPLKTQVKQTPARQQDTQPPNAGTKAPHHLRPNDTEEELIARSRRMTSEHEDFNIFDEALGEYSANWSRFYLPLLVRRIDQVLRGCNLHGLPARIDPQNQDKPFPIGGPQLFES